MMDRKLERLKFETSMHHKENLRNQIDPKMIDQLQISETPSTNYKNAYKNLYHDELEKSLMLHENKRNIEQVKHTYEDAVNDPNLINSRIQGGNTMDGMQYSLSNSRLEHLKNTNSAINVSNLNYRDVAYHDYDLLKQTKALQHTYKNYDGGQAFYRSNERHQLGALAQLQNMRNTLQNQLTSKEQQKKLQMLKKYEEQMAMKQRQYEQNMQKSLSLHAKLQQKQQHRNVIKDQIQAERIKRGRRSLFNYNIYQRHNPITNPIQYHIDNPYILKQIQNQKQMHR